jgi:glutaminyl-peptide cyclotransferase
VLLRLSVVTVAVAVLGTAVGCHSAKVDPGATQTEAKLRPVVLAQIPHDPSAFTEGLELDGPNLYESTGKVGHSQLREIDPATGALRRAVPLRPDYWGEGIAVVGDRIWQMTYRNGVAIEWDKATFTPVREVHMDGEGWGLCWDGKRLVQSDGTNRLHFRDGANFAETGSVAVKTPDGDPLKGLNELACVGGQVWANVVTVIPSDQIARIDPNSGLVTAIVDADGLFVGPRADNQTLNGIANVDSQTFLLTGKYWPSMFRVRFEQAK